MSLSIFAGACERFMSHAGGKEPPPPPFLFTPPPGWEMVPGIGIGPLVSYYAPDEYGGFKANIQIFEEAIEHPRQDSKILWDFWYEGVDQAKVMVARRPTGGKRAHVSGADFAAIYAFDSQYETFKVRQKKLLTSSGNKRYVVSCTALRTNYGPYEPVFDDALASFSFPQPTTQPATRQAETTTRPTAGAAPKDQK